MEKRLKSKNMPIEEKHYESKNVFASSESPQESSDKKSDGTK